VLAFPHTGTFVPTDIWEKLTPLGRTLEDTDWHVDQLYTGLLDSATTVRATFHRYVIDANRAPDGVSLYPGQNTTTLVPLTDFNGEDLWITPPSPQEIESRRLSYHAPYHKALRDELERVREKHGYAVLYDCHSIRSGIPFLFEGVLPDFSIGTNNGATCSAGIEQRVERICREDTLFSTVLNGRFKGGWTTRHYGQPDQGIHAIQMELTQSAYLQSESTPFEYSAIKADRLRVTLKKILDSLTDQAASKHTNLGVNT
jgi:formiminoglutamase